MGFIGAILSAVVKGLMAFFLPSKDEKLGQLEATNKANQEVLNDIEKANAARNSPAELERVRSKYERKDQ